MLYDNVRFFNQKGVKSKYSLTQDNADACGEAFLRGLEPGLLEETSPLQRTIEIYNHFAVIIRKQ